MLLCLEPTALPALQLAEVELLEEMGVAVHTRLFKCRLEEEGQREA